MRSTLKISKRQSAGSLCSFAYPGIFSRLSNDGKQSPALFVHLPALSKAGNFSGLFSTFVHVVTTKAFREKPTVFSPCNVICSGSNTAYSNSLIHCP
jgi:hypothetical protein